MCYNNLSFRVHGRLFYGSLAHWLLNEMATANGAFYWFRCRTLPAYDVKIGIWSEINCFRMKGRLCNLSCSCEKRGGCVTERDIKGVID